MFVIHLESPGTADALGRYTCRKQRVVCTCNTEHFAPVGGALFSARGHARRRRSRASLSNKRAASNAVESTTSGGAAAGGTSTGELDDDPMYRYGAASVSGVPSDCVLRYSERQSSGEDSSQRLENFVRIVAPIWQAHVTGIENIQNATLRSCKYLCTAAVSARLEGPAPGVWYASFKVNRKRSNSSGWFNAHPCTLSYKISGLRFNPFEQLEHRPPLWHTGRYSRRQHYIYCARKLGYKVPTRIARTSRC